VTGRSPLWTGLSLLLLAAPGLWAQEAPEAPASEPPQDEPIELAEEITVTAGHGDRRIQDVPLRVEVVDREEIEEKALMTPGSVAMLLGETTGLLVQITAPSTGAANVRIQGLRGRYALLLRPAPGWTARLGAGSGFFTPTPFLEENDESGLARVLPLAAGLVAERALSAAFDLGWLRVGFEVNATLFGSRVEDALQRRWGTELLLRYRRGGLMLLATHSYTSSSEDDPEAPGNRRDVPLTPRHVASFNAIWEDEGRGRIGVEAYYTAGSRRTRTPTAARARPTC
jgi:outer membrane receptor protein involved in Fe transport